MKEIEKLKGLLLSDADRAKKHKEAPTARVVDASKHEILAWIKKTGASGNAELIVAMEKAIVEHELEYYNNHRLMKASLQTDLNELAAIEWQLGIVDDPTQYKHVNAAYSLPKSHSQGLPLDEARQSFRSHIARLNNQAKAPLSDSAKEIIEIRKTATGAAEKDYIARQAKTLGVEPA